MNHLAPLILDSSATVRVALLELFSDLSPQVVSKEALQAHFTMLLLYIQSAMTHIQSDIRSDSTKFLAWALEIGGPEVVRSSWTKILASYAGLLGWNVDGQERARIQLARGSSLVGNPTVTSRHVCTLYTLLSNGISEPSTLTRQHRPKTWKYPDFKSTSLNHPQIFSYLLPSYSAPFVHLNLFTYGQTESQVSSHDVPSRRTQLHSYIDPLLVYLHNLTAELGPSDLSRSTTQTIIDDLRISIIRILALLNHVYISVDSDDIPNRSWDKSWKRAILKMSNLIECRKETEGSRRLVREWELANIHIAQ
jgi:Rix1 complex component involved in 60S ribosome maturation